MNWHVIVPSVIVWGLAFLTAWFYFRKKPEAGIARKILSIVLFVIVYSVLFAVLTTVFGF